MFDFPGITEYIIFIMKSKIIIKTMPGCSAPVIACPECGEILSPADIEGFWKCPYCNFSFDRDALLEDFVASPLLQRWAGAAYSRLLRP